MLPLTTLAADTKHCKVYHFDHPFYPRKSCKEIYYWNPQTYNMSEYYWLITPPCHVYVEQRPDAVSCRKIYDSDIQIQNKSGHYWRLNPLHCDMEQ